MKNEGDVKKKVKAVLAKHAPESWWFMPPANGYGRAGIPDFVGCHYGAAFAIETKFGYGTLTANQERECGNAVAAGVRVWIVNEKNITKFEQEFALFAATAAGSGKGCPHAR